MKKRRILLFGAVALWLAGFIWVISLPRAAVPSVTLARITKRGGDWFQITNGFERAILLTDLIVETNSSAGWRAFSHTVPSHPQRLATGETKDLVIAAPTNGQIWRLRVSYGQDVKGPALFLGKAAYAVSHGAWPGQGFGIMAGSNSCTSEEIR